MRNTSQPTLGTLTMPKGDSLHRLMNVTFLIALAMISVGTLGSPLVAAHPSTASATLTEWSVPTPASGPWALTLDPSGKCCWFVEYFGSKLGHLDPSTGTFQEWVIPTPSSNPYSIATTVISGSLAVWGTEFGADRIFMFSPQSGLFREYNLTNYNSGVTYISVEPPSVQVRVWFTESFRNVNGEAIYDPKTGNVTLYEDEFPAAVGGGAYGVYAGSNSVWFAGFSALVRWDRSSQQYTMWPLPVHGSAVGRLITLDQFGEPWYTQGVTDGNSTDNYVGVLRANTTLEEWQVRSPGADARGIGMNPITQQPWIAEESQQAGYGMIASLDPFAGGGTLVPSAPATALSGGTPVALASIPSQVVVSTHIVTPSVSLISGSQHGQFTEYAVGPTLPHDAIVDSSGSVWISEPGTNRIARLSLTSADFALSATPPVISLSQSGSGIVAISGASVSGYTGRVSLAITAAPRDVTISSFSPNPLDISPGGKVSSRFTINIAPNASAGPNTIMIQGTDGNITHEISLLLMVTNSTSPFPSTGLRCLIATATYGSDLSPEVQLLRNFRDNAVEKSKAGSSFLIVFNAWYYSFSPYVANYIATHWVARVGMRFVLYPLIAFVYAASKVYKGLQVFPELAILASGLVVSCLIGGFYIGLPFGLLNRRFRLTRNPNVKFLGSLLVAAVGAVMVGQILSSTVLLMISSSLMVLISMLLSAASTASLLSHKKNLCIARRGKDSSLQGDECGS